MQLPVYNRGLLHSVMASALVLGGATACSGSDRTESGSDNSAAVMQDTSSTSPEIDTTIVTGDVPESGAAAGYRAMERDTTSETSQNTADTTAAGYETADEQEVTPNEQ